MAQGDAYEHVAAMHATGMTAEEIYLALLTDGWTVQEVQSTYERVVAKDPGVDLQQRVVRLVLAVGAILVGAGAFSFVAANWRSMSSALRIAVILTSFLLMSAAGWWVREYRGYRMTGEALLLVGNIIFGAGIFLVAQIYNTSAEWPTGFILWMLGTLVVAAATESTTLHGLAVLAGGAGTVAYPFAIVAGAPYEPILATAPMLSIIGSIAAITGAVRLLNRDATIHRERW